MKYTFVALLCLMLLGCGEIGHDTSDNRVRKEQEATIKEAMAQAGLPAIKNFRERKILKEIYELRDQEGLVTYTYLFSDMTGKLVYLGETIGYGISSATQYTNPMRAMGSYETEMTGNVTLPQADPNGLFSPQSAEGTWVLLKDPNGKDVKPIYCEPRILVSPFKLNIN